VQSERNQSTTYADSATFINSKSERRSYDAVKIQAQADLKKADIDKPVSAKNTNICVRE
jgi:hypothetical protein